MAWRDGNRQTIHLSFGSNCPNEPGRLYTAAMHDVTREDEARVAQHQAEQPDDPARAGIVGELDDEAGKIDLRLDARWRLEPHLVRLWAVLRPDRCQVSLHGRVGAGVAKLPDLAGQSRGAQIGKGRHTLAQEVEIGCPSRLHPDRTAARRMAADRMAARRSGADQVLVLDAPRGRAVRAAGRHDKAALAERDYQEFKQEVGLGHYEGRGWRGFHHHGTLCIAAYGFLISERETIPPSGPRAPESFQSPAVPQGYRPRGAADPARAPHPQLDRDHASTPHPCPRKDARPLPMLRDVDQHKTKLNRLMTQ